MNPIWTPIFAAQAAQSSQEPSLFALTDYAIITVDGPDACKFLQGQCTSDFNQLTDDNWQLGAHCNAKGRMIFSYVAAKLAPEIIGLRVHASLAETALGALQKYAVFSKATLSISTQLAFAHTTEQTFAGKMLSYSLGDESWQEIWIEAEETQQLAFTSQETWQQACLQAGLCHVQAASSEKHVPQALNYDLIDGVNFKKGCYTGQEIIARLHYRGQSKQRVHLVFAETCEQPKLGDALQNAQQKTIGEVVDSCPYDGGHLILLCSSGHQDPAESLTLLDQPQVTLQAMGLPYAIP